MLHDHHRDVVELDRIGQRDQRTLVGADHRRLVVVDPVADVFHARGGEQLRRLVGLGQAGPEPADRPLAGEFLQNAHRARDHRGLIRLLVDRALLVGMAHELPAGVLRLLRDARVVLADARIDRERRADVQPREQVEEAPHADAHAVFVPAPVRHVGQHRLPGRRGQHLPRHRLADVPHFEVHDGPEHDAARRPAASAAAGRRSPNSRRARAGVWASGIGVIPGAA